MIVITNEDRQIPRGRKRSTERRKHFRFPMSVPAIFTWEQFGDAPLTSEGITRDVSANGAYIFCRTCPPHNAKVQVELRIAQYPDAPTIVMTAKMLAQRVDRAVPGEKDGGFAIVGGEFVSRQLLRTLPLIVPTQKRPAPIPIGLYQPVKGIEHATHDRSSDADLPGLADKEITIEQRLPSRSDV